MITIKQVLEDALIQLRKSWIEIKQQDIISAEDEKVLDNIKNTIYYIRRGLKIVKKYKKEFNWWLDGGRCLHSYNGVEWHETKESTWAKHPIHIIINDEYVEFRKALAEGKSLQRRILWGENCSFDKSWNDWNNDNGLRLNHNGTPCEYRIKPEEPKFKVGDWVRHLQPYDEIFQWNGEGCASLDKVELWKPQVGEFVIPDNLAGTKGFQVLQWKKSDTYKCQPFIGELPSKVKGK